MLIHEAIPKIMLEVGAIEKDRKNDQQGYKFRGIDDVYNALQSPMAKHGVFVVPEVLERWVSERQTKNGGTLFYTTLKVKFTFLAGDASHVIAVTIGEAMDSGDKSANKAMSAAMKYAMLQVFCIPTEEPKDTENETHQVAATKDPLLSDDVFHAEWAKAIHSRVPLSEQHARGFLVALLVKRKIDLTKANLLQRQTLLSEVSSGKHDGSLKKKHAELTAPAKPDTNIDAKKLFEIAVKGKPADMSDADAINSLSIWLAENFEKTWSNMKPLEREAVYARITSAEPWQSVQAGV